MSDSKGRWVWHEVMTTDLAKGRDYYAGMFGWDATEMDMGTGPYTIFKQGEAMVVGMAQTQGGAPSHWLGYVDVGDVDVALAKVPALGGEVLMPAYDIPNIGRMGIVKDPAGAVFAPFQGAGEDTRDWSKPPGMHTVCWSELMTADLDAATGFYGELVGWTFSSDMGPDMKVMKVGDAMVASMRQLPAEAAGMPAHWMNYVLVEEVDVHQSKAESLGATVLRGDTEIPGMGRFAILQDPTGAVSAIWKDLSNNS